MEHKRRDIDGFYLDLKKKKLSTKELIIFSQIHLCMKSNVIFLQSLNNIIPFVLIGIARMYNCKDLKLKLQLISNN